MILAYGKGLAEDQAEAEVKHAIITIPSYWG